MMNWGYGLNGMGWIGMLFGGLMMVLIWGGFIALAFFAVRALVRPGQTKAGQVSIVNTASGNRSLEILKERYAQGDITKEQFEDMQRDLAS